MLFSVLVVISAGWLGSLPGIAGDTANYLQAQEACDDPTRSITLFAERLGPNRIGYGRTPEKAKIPGPTIQMREGGCLQVTLVNDTNERVSLHPHGVDYGIDSDGTPLNKSCVPPRESRTYVWSAHTPSARTDGTIEPGSAGYWHYHDHCMGTPHGTDGIEAGLFGALIVRRPSDPVPDRKPFVVVMSGTEINLRRAPNTPTFRADLGERVEFVVIGHGELFHTFHLHAHRWVDNRTGMPTELTDATTVIDNKTVGPGDSFGFQIIAGERVGPGAWMYHCHVQGHSDAGMSGIFLVRTPEGQLTTEAREVMRAFQNTQPHGGHHE